MHTCSAARARLFLLYQFQFALDCSIAHILLADKSLFYGDKRAAVSVEVAFGQRSALAIKNFGDRKGAITRSNHEEILDKEEFEKEVKNEESVKHAKKEARRKIVSPAEELGLMDANKEQELFFFQLPEILPFIKQPSAAVDQKSNKVENANTAANLKDLPSGRLGKMMVYRSGKIKMKMGDTLFDSHRDSNNMQIEDHQNNKSSESLVKRKCKLLGWEKVVAEGTIVSTDPNASVYFVKLGQDV